MHIVIGITLISFFFMSMLFWNQRRIDVSHHHSLLIIKEPRRPKRTIPVHETVYSIKRPWGGQGRIANPI
jgi:hypothetical protein